MDIKCLKIDIVDAFSSIVTLWISKQLLNIDKMLKFNY